MRWAADAAVAGRRRPGAASAAAAARDEDDGDERRDRPSASSAQLADHGCIWIVPGWPGPLHGGTVASVFERRRDDRAIPSMSKAMPTGATGAAPQ